MRYCLPKGNVLWLLSMYKTNTAFLKAEVCQINVLRQCSDWLLTYINV